MPGYNFGKEISGGKETYKDFPSNKQRTGKSSSWESGVLHFWILVWRSALSGRPGTSTLEGGAREGERGLLCLNPVAPGCTINESGCLGMQPQLGAQPSVRWGRQKWLNLKQLYHSPSKCFTWICMYWITAYKALYRIFGGFVADVAAINQLCTSKDFWKSTSWFVFRILFQVVLNFANSQVLKITWGFLCTRVCINVHDTQLHEPTFQLHHHPSCGNSMTVFCSDKCCWGRNLYNYCKDEPCCCQTSESSNNDFMVRFVENTFSVTLTARSVTETYSSGKALLKIRIAVVAIVYQWWDGFWLTKKKLWKLIWF